MIKNYILFCIIRILSYPYFFFRASSISGKMCVCGVVMVSGDMFRFCSIVSSQYFHCVYIQLCSSILVSA